MPFVNGHSWTLSTVLNSVAVSESCTVYGEANDMSDFGKKPLCWHESKEASILVCKSCVHGAKSQDYSQREVFIINIKALYGEIQFKTNQCK